MSLSLDTVLQVIEIVNKAVDVYQKIQDAPEQMRKIGKRMERLKALLGHLEQLLRKREKRALARLRPTQTEDLLAILEDIRDDSSRVDLLFRKWENDIGPFGLQFRFKTLAQAYFALGSNSEKLASLGDDIDRHRQDVIFYLSMMGCAGIDELLINGIPVQTSPARTVKPNAVAAGLSMAKAQTATRPGGRNSTAKQDQPSRRDYKILFVDPHNLARSVVAEAVMKLLRGWTIMTGGEWRIEVIHSAGFFVKHRSEVVETIKGLSFTHDSYRMSLSAGNRAPNAVPLEAVFDNKSYDYPFKKAIQDEMTSRRSRGLPKDIFRIYDYIMVFTGREHDNMLQLRRALVAEEGKDIAPKGKGRLLHLGHYLTLDGIPREIVDAPKKPDGTDSRENWNFKVSSQIKIGLKGFLRQEMGWKQPAQNAKSGS
ncbi:hypothetical protein NKR23_g3345 [Pleurostoma richardsiae]|uniref:Uncharacterized protein n=1 Tax=Pleurostoma richardsiae TaxID=41990 RepID=A0AA38RUG3_9PEZI|nr:hypothetical protein NKR23_g3345 [Pleurostoma richardsiae]